MYPQKSHPGTRPHIGCSPAVRRALEEANGAGLTTKEIHNKPYCTKYSMDQICCAVRRMYERKQIQKDQNSYRGEFRYFIPLQGL